MQGFSLRSIQGFHCKLPKRMGQKDCEFEATLRNVEKTFYKIKRKGVLGRQPIVSLAGETPWIQCSLEGNSERGSYIKRSRLKESEALVSGKMIEVTNIRTCCESKSMMGTGNNGKQSPD